MRGDQKEIATADLRPWPYLFALIIPLSVAVGYWIGGIGTFFTVLLSFGLIPLADLLIGRDPTNLSPEQEDQIADTPRFRLILIVYPIVQIALTVWGAMMITGPQLALLEKIGLTVSVGISNGAVGITVAHELLHRRNRWERWLGEILLMTVCYMHFAIEHIKGHHVRVATHADPATARKGESFYRFFRRTLFGSLISAWRLETNRLCKLHQYPVSPRNKMIWYCILPLVTALSLAAVFGMSALLFFAAQSFVAITLLEIVNYIEHYGLVRQQISPGKYEKVGLRHAWNSDYRLSNFLLFKLQRHADHHMRPARRYQILETHDESPQLPYGYPSMALIVLVPPLWRRLMDKRLESFQLSQKLNHL